MSKIFLFQNKDKIADHEPDYIVRIQIGDTWQEAGVGIKGITAKGTGYFEMDVSDDMLVDKLRDVDFIAKTLKTQSWLAEHDAAYNEKHYPKMTVDEAYESM